MKERVLIVDDDQSQCDLFAMALERHGYEPASTTSPREALELVAREPFDVVVTDLGMTEMDGLELCRKVRGRPGSDYVYFILLTGKLPSGDNQREAIEAGVDDFLSKPLVTQEIWMRLRVAERILRFATQVRQLEAFLPICGYCKKIRDDQNYWQQIEAYIGERTGSDFSHSICPDCYQRVVLPELQQLKATPKPPPSVERKH